MTTTTLQSIGQEAEAFIVSCYRELGKDEASIEARLGEIRRELAIGMTYTHTAEELEHGARMAWRNSNRCIGRLFWESLTVVDARHIEDEAGMGDALLNHIQIATNDGKIKPVITVFPQETPGRSAVRIWNHQLIRYAGYKSNSGAIVGDPASVDFTKRCMELGWRGAGTPFDVLPLLFTARDGSTCMMPIPSEVVMEVPIAHPGFPSFTELGLRWYAVPIVSDMRLSIGGITYTAAPFNGWYMGTEIGARNLADINRYNMLPVVARNIGLDTTSDSTLWKDRALVELNVAVLHSFKECGVSIVDHHTAAQQYQRFQHNEAKKGRETTGRWSWLIPPLSPAATPIFHNSFEDRIELPNFFYQ